MLAARDVRKSFGSVVAVSGVTLDIDRGATFGLLGPNGAGKTTMMRMILGIMEPDQGRISWNGAPIDEHARMRFGYLPEERGLYGKMQVRDHIVYFARLHGFSKDAARSAAGTWIERLDLGKYADRPCAELSKGNQQKVQVACAAVHRPELLVLDEPFTGLDPVNAAILRSVVEELRDAGTTLILSSHEMWQLERLCTEFCIVAQGSVRTSGTLAGLRAQWPARRIRIAPDTPDVRSVLAASPELRVVDASDGVIVEAPRAIDVTGLLQRLVAIAPIAAFEPLEPSLRELYLHALGEDGHA